MNETCTTCGGSSCVCSTAQTIRALEGKLALAEARERALRAMINKPELVDFLRGVRLEAIHQVERWSADHDRAKRPADWFWLVGYLAGKALHAAIASDRDKARHHCVSTAAALYNWHCAIQGFDVRMCPGRADVAVNVEGDVHD